MAGFLNRKEILTEKVTLLLADGGCIEGEEMQKVAIDMLVEAAGRGYIEIVRTLIDAGVAVNGQLPELYYSMELTALRVSVKFGHVEVTRMLLDAGADANAESRDGEPTILWAAASADWKVVEMLLDAGADVNAFNHGSLCIHRYPPDALSCAAKRGNTKTIKLLLDAGATINPGNKEGEANALYYAAFYGHIEAVMMLLKAGSWVDVCDKSGGTPLLWAAKNASSEIVRLLIKARANVNKSCRCGDTPLAAALKVNVKDRAEKFQMLLAAGADFDNINIKDAMLCAARDGDVESLRLLASTGIYLEAEFSSDWGPEALREASSRGYVDVVQFLIRKGANIHVEGDDRLTALMQAGNQEVLDILVEAGATISADKAKRAGAFRQAICSDKVDLLRALLGAGVDVNHSERFWNPDPPLVLAAKEGAVEMLPFLIAAGAELEDRTYKGKTALIRAAQVNSMYAVGVLVGAGANVNATANDSWTPLKYAMRNTNRKMVQMLLGAGAEMTSQAQRFLNEMDRSIAAVLSIFPPTFPAVLLQDITNLVLEEHSGRFLRERMWREWRTQMCKPESEPGSCSSGLRAFDLLHPLIASPLFHPIY